MTAPTARLGLRAKLLTGMFLILCVSIGLVASQAVLLFQEDKSSYVFDLNASQAIKIADEVQANVRHLTEKVRILYDAVRLPVPSGPERTAVLVSMLRQYPEFLLLSARGEDGSLQNLTLSQALGAFGLTVEAAHAAYAKGVPFDAVTADRPFVGRLDLGARQPTFTLAVRALPGSDGRPGPVLVAEVPLDRLYASRGDSRLFEVCVTDAAARPLVAPPRPAPAAGRPGGAAAGTDAAALAALLPKTTRTAGTREYAAAGVPMLAAYAPAGDLGLWAVVQIPKARAFEAARRLVTRSLVLAGVVCLAALGLVLFFSASITKPLLALTRATEQIGRGQFDVQVPVSGGDEIGALGGRFKRMTEELAARETALREANKRLVESEKMSALGQLGAGIAHEVKNPLTSIRGYAQMGQRKVPADHPLHDYFATIEKETGRSLEILKNLLKFSRQETAEMTLIDLNTVVSDAVKLVTHQLEMKKVETTCDLCEQPLRVLGNANQIEQVLLNLCMNAGDAMEKTGGSLRVATESLSAQACIRITDTGSGIPPEILGKIFDPFFTTKPVGKGTGLGLSVSYGIVKDHKGEISVQSKMGQGTTFTILIPIAQPGAETPAAPAPAPQRLRVINLR
jgi:two-component system NtrC family sensor kinase